MNAVFSKKVSLGYMSSLCFMCHKLMPTRLLITECNRSGDRSEDDEIPARFD